MPSGTVPGYTLFAGHHRLRTTLPHDVARPCSPCEKHEQEYKSDRPRREPGSIDRLKRAVVNFTRHRRAAIYGSAQRHRAGLTGVRSRENPMSSRHTPYVDTNSPLSSLPSRYKVNFGAGLEHATVDASAHAARCQNINKPSAHTGAILSISGLVTKYQIICYAPLSLFCFCSAASPWPPISPAITPAPTPPVKATKARFTSP